MSRFLRPIAAVVFAIALTQTVKGGAAISLVPNNPGPYFGGENLVVDVYVTSNQSVIMRLLGFDFSATDPAIMLTGPDGPDHDTIPEFVFDFSTLLFGSSVFYATFPNLPVPQTVLSSFPPISGSKLLLPGGLPFHAGSIAITLPQEPGDYLLDAMNFETQDTYSGARIDFGFGDHGEATTWSTLDDGEVELTGGQRTFVVVPEPTSLAMLALGIVSLDRRRAARRGGIA